MKTSAVTPLKNLCWNRRKHFSRSWNHFKKWNISPFPIDHLFAFYYWNYSNHRSEKRARGRTRSAQPVIARHVPIITCSRLRQKMKKIYKTFFHHHLYAQSRRQTCKRVRVWRHIFGPGSKMRSRCLGCEAPHLFARPGSSKIGEQGKKWTATWYEEIIWCFGLVFGFICIVRS